MGIQGLLPLLKPIQIHRHLSDFAGQTLAVDAYVWLHRGAYACATELATGRPTTKYVDFCIHRVRLLRHYNILPFLVFDGGPLPAKGGTEKDREKKRAESLDRANSLAAQGKHTQAREHYVKCVDVTPQMAFQVIKVLKAESVPYIVAPYEADAQLAYLERAGLVDGIITEDSDLLVFGCKNVLFKLDIVSATITSISRSDFGSPSLGEDSLSLIGWSDCQFRWMAMLSGCDYLPSIPGIGLKTAWTLLRKYKTVQNVIRAIRLEGKKSIPHRYLDAFKLAEKVFLHQRVYDPGLERLVHLTDCPTGEDLDEATAAYVGKDLDPSLAKKIAEGDACPISLLPMEDINPSFVPKSVRSLPLRAQDPNTPVNGKAKGKEKATSSGGLLNFFTPLPKATTSPKRPATHPTSVGRASGKRTLVDVMDEDMAVKKKRLEELQRKRAVALSSSRFFGGGNADGSPIAGSSRLSPVRKHSKENTPVLEEVEHPPEAEDLVAQEDGYISPSPSLSRQLTPDLSSPVRPQPSKNPIGHEDDGDAVSSPVLPRSHRTTNPTYSIQPMLPMDVERTADGARILVRESESPCRTTHHAPSTQHIFPTDVERTADGARILVRGSESPSREQQMDEEPLDGPDLRFNFDDEELSSEIGGWDDDTQKENEILEDTPPCSFPRDTRNEEDEDRFLYNEDLAEEAMAAVRAKVADGWRAKFGFGADRGAGREQPTSMLKRRKTASSEHLRRSPARRIKPRRSEPYPATRKNVDVFEDNTTSLSDDLIEELVDNTRGRLEAFRYNR
ncbi:hypothetical protein BD410DRAFT_614988 [Rickenella mellea]|uniref:Uncharacterized protein n=1 Tax=Rickenella mellea TaxID=50990 RepID=A0A4Y7PMS0_9AGAM|nr:hypothetical protein BD410DRAFT_614988 [Rickenella mellea]